MTNELEDYKFHSQKWIEENRKNGMEEKLCEEVLDEMIEFS